MALKNFIIISVQNTSNHFIALHNTSKQIRPAHNTTTHGKAIQFKSNGGIQDEHIRKVGFRGKNRTALIQKNNKRIVCQDTLVLDSLEQEGGETHSAQNPIPLLSIYAYSLFLSTSLRHNNLCNSSSRVRLLPFSLGAGFVQSKPAHPIMGTVN